jgi:internalin A
LVVLGDPGSGKSTLVSWIAWQLTQHSGPWRERLGSLVPFPMILREMKLDATLDADGLLAAFLAHPVAEKLRATPGVVRELLERGQAFLLLDGLDEIGDLAVRKALRRAVYALGNRYPSCRVLLTTRIIGYEQAPFVLKVAMPQGIIYTPEQSLIWADRRYVAPFTNEQIEQFAQNWYTRREAAEELRKAGAGEFIAAVHGSEATLRLARVPNLLTLMALIHRVQRKLPHGRALLFEKIAEAYLESIDSFRGIQEVDYPLTQKKRWLAYVGFQMQRRRGELAAAKERKPEEAVPEVLVSQQDVAAWILEAMAGSARGADPLAAERFLDYIGRRSGLLLPRGEGLFAFTHLSFQEYFAAVHIADQVISPRWLSGKVASGVGPENLSRYANEATWRESLLLLFELLADRPEWLEVVIEPLFGEGYEKVVSGGQGQENRAMLLAAISVDPYSGLTREERTSAWRACWVWEILYQQEEIPGPIVARILTSTDPSEIPAVWSVFEEVLRDLQPTRLNLEDCLGLGVATLHAIGGVSNLQYLDLSGTAVEDLSPLSGLTNLRTLFVIKTSVSDIAPLAGLANLRALALRSTPVTDLSPLSSLVNLQVLNLSDTPIREVSALSHLEGLQFLYLNRTQVRDVSPLANLVNLAALFVENTPISDVSPLSHLTKLKLVR